MKGIPMFATLLLALVAANPLPKTTEKLDQKLPAIVDQLEMFSQKGIDFIEAQAPEVCHEIILLGKVQYTSLNAAFVAMFFVGIALWCYARYESKKYNFAQGTFSECACVIKGILGLLMIIIAPIVVFCWAREAFVVWFAPRVYLIEYFSKLTGLMK